MIINSASLAELFRTYNAAFKKGLDSTSNDWSKVATLIRSSGASNLYPFLGQFPQLREWVGDRVIKSMAAHSYTVVNKKFESTIGVPAEDILDDSYGVYSTIMEDMGFAAQMHPDQLVFDLLAAGISELCYDGQFFFDTDHPTIASGVAGTESNYDSAGGGALWYLLDTQRPLKPLIFQQREEYSFQSRTKQEDEHVFTADEYRYGTRGRASAGFGFWQMAYASKNTLNATNFDAYSQTMMARKSDSDHPYGIRPTVLVCGPSSRSAARDLLETERLASGGSNKNYQEVDLIISPYLT